MTGDEDDTVPVSATPRRQQRHHITAQVRPELLTWARESAGLSQDEAAKKLAVGVARVEGWESGDRPISVAQLRRAADVYRRSLAVFFLAEPPVETVPIRDFRRRPDAGEHLSRGLRTEIRKALHRHDLAMELSASLGTTVPTFSVQLARSTDPAEAGRKLRHVVGMTREDQSRLRSARAPLSEWIRRIERVGVLVFQTGALEDDDVRGVSVWQERYPVIVLDGGDSPRARVFTLLHELAHLALRDGGVCDLHERGGRRELSDVESYCNAVAANALVPREELEAEIGELRLRREWADDEIQRLADRFWVSREVLLLRLVAYNYATQAFYQRKRAEYEAEYVRLAKQKRKGAPPYSVMVLRNNGTEYTRLVLEAYRRREITPVDVAEYLGVNLRHLPAIESTAEAAVS
jgi:Zn-dependent peptidase ImmA (M78 family)/transcriptional regulator with XRE-family HTH domain